MSSRHGFLGGVALLLLVALAGIASGDPVSRVDGGCRLFPRTSHWNQRVDLLPAAPGSNRLVRKMGADRPLFADFSIPYTVVAASQPRKRVRFLYRSESDPGPYPIPRDVPIEGGVDRHALIVDRDRCRLYELYWLRRSRGRWHAGSGAIWSLRSNRMRPRGWTSADAAGLPILPGLVRYDEVAEGAIHHAIRFTADDTGARFVYPARHYQDDDPDRHLPPLGLRMRLRARVDVSQFPPQAQVILRALKEYGMILADEGEPWFISGAPSPNWDFQDLATLMGIKGSDFEVVDTSRLPKPGLRNQRRR
jgi:hypothetical protein